MLIYFGNNQADLCRQVKQTLHYGNKRCKIEKIVKNKLTPDNMITFNKPVYFFGDTYKNDDSIDAMIIGDNGEEIILLQEDEEFGNLIGLTTDMIAEITDIIERGDYEIEG